MCGQELPASVQGGGRFVEDGVVGLEDVWYSGGDVEGDVGGGGLPGEADGVVEEDLVVPAWMTRGGRPDRSAKIGLIRPRDASCPDV